MSGIDYVGRTDAVALRKELEELEDSYGGSRQDNPAYLSINEINELPELFQPRGESLAFSPGRSVEHVERLKRLIARGVELDAVWVVSFGDRWYLVDGHHRLEAFRRAGVTNVPVNVLSSDLSGGERIAWAVEQSQKENQKNRLNMSDAEKQDAAWRMVVRSEGGSKSSQANIAGVSPSSIGNMRRTLGELQAAGRTLQDLESLGWRRATFEASRIGKQIDDGAGGFDEAKRRNLTRALSGAIRQRPSALMLLEVLMEMREGILTDLETAISIKKEELSRPVSTLDI